MFERTISLKLIEMYLKEQGFESSNIDVGRQFHGS